MAAVLSVVKAGKELKESYPNQENVMRLIDEALKRAAQLGEAYSIDLSTDFIQAQDALSTAAEVRSQLALVLTAGRRMIDWAERKTIQLIIGDEPITSQQMSHLVRIRLICAELINLLNTTLDRVRKQPVYSGQPA